MRKWEKRTSFNADHGADNFNGLYKLSQFQYCLVNAMVVSLIP